MPRKVGSISEEVIALHASLVKHGVMRPARLDVEAIIMRVLGTGPQGTRNAIVAGRGLGLWDVTDGRSGPMVLLVRKTPRFSNVVAPDPASVQEN